MTNCFYISVGVGIKQIGYNVLKVSFRGVDGHIFSLCSNFGESQATGFPLRRLYWELH